jgi:hypothetical protein
MPSPSAPRLMVTLAPILELCFALLQQTFACLLERHTIISYLLSRPTMSSAYFNDPELVSLDRCIACDSMIYDLARAVVRGCIISCSQMPGSDWLCTQAWTSAGTRSQTLSLWPPTPSLQAQLNAG